MTEISDILKDWAAAQDVARNEDLGRFVIEGPCELNAIGAVVKGLLGEVEFALEPLHEEGSTTFSLLRLPGPAWAERSDLFQVAHALQNALGAITVEPDIGSDYFLPDASRQSAVGPEGATAAVWCWATQRPTDDHWALARIRAPAAWRYSEEAGRPDRGHGILVFQPDTGVVTGHQLLPTGLTQHPKAANFVEPGFPPEDRLSRGNPGHGTGTASVVVGHHAPFGPGVAPKATLIPLRCLKSVAVFNQSRVAQAIDYARRHGAHVISLSLGGVPSRALQAAVRAAVGAHVIVLAAAGNCVMEVVWPARYAEVIALGGINEAGAPWRGSSRGAAVAISAPAEFVRRAEGQNLPAGISGGQGTSFATALTAGVAALWLAHHGRDALIAVLPAGETLQSMFRRVLARAAHRADGFDHCRFGAGVVDAEAVLKVSPASVFAGQPVSTSTSEGSSVRALLTSVFGPGRSESALARADSPQFEAELACLALDRARLQNSGRSVYEGSLPPNASETLRERLGPTWWRST